MLSLILCLLVSLVGCWAQSEDQTIIPETYGYEVVEAAVENIKYTCIFPDDSFFGRRMAYVETNDGQVIDAYPEDYNGGIWKIDEAMYEQTKNPKREETHTHITAIYYSSSLYNINWLSTRWEDLRMPLYSALAAQLYIFDQVGRDYSIPHDIESQAQFWQDYIRPTGNPEEFVVVADTLEDSCDTARGADIVFVLDGSTSIESTNFDLVKDFVSEVVSAFDISSENYRIGVQKFADGNEIEFYLNTYDNKEDVLNAIDSIEYIGGTTNTAAALNDLVQISFTEEHGARGSSSGFQQIAFVITDGISNVEEDTLEAAALVHEAKITTFAITVGTDISEIELHAIASDPDCIHKYELVDFDDFAKIIDAIQRSTCEAPVTFIPNNETTEGKFNPKEDLNCQVILPSEGATFKMLSEDVPVHYYVAKDTYPNPAYYDDMVTTYPDRTALMYINGSIGDQMYCYILHDGAVTDNITIGVRPGDDDNCAEIICQNGGRCNDLIYIDQWECICPPGFEGTYCEITSTTTAIPPPTTTSTVPPPTTTSTVPPPTTTPHNTADDPCDCDGIYAADPCPGCVGSDHPSCTTGNLWPHFVLSDGTYKERFCQCDDFGKCFEHDCADGLIYLECINACAFPGTPCP